MNLDTLKSIFGLVSTETVGALVRPQRVSIGKKARSGVTTFKNQPRNKAVAKIAKQARRRQRGRR